MSTANPRGRPRAFDRTAALEQAMDLFWRHGYEGVSLADLTAAMGIRPPSLYASFGSKAALFKEALARYNEVEGAGPHAALWDAPTARAGVAALLRHHARAYVDPARPTGCMVALSATTIGADHDDIHGFVAGCRRADVADLARRVERGIADGDVPAHAVPDAVAEYVYAVSLGMAVRARDGAGGAALSAIAEAAIASWDAVVSAGQGSSAPGEAAPQVGAETGTVGPGTGGKRSRGLVRDG